MVSGPEIEQAANRRQPIQGSQLPSWLVGIAAAKKIARETPRGDSATVSSLIVGLSSSNPSLRISAAKALASASNFGDHKVLEALLNLNNNNGASRPQGVDDENSEVRIHSLETVSKLVVGTASSPICAKLLQKLHDPDWAVRQAATAALATTSKTDDNAVLGHLQSMLREDTWWAKVAAADALSRIASRGNAHVVSHLTGILKDADWAVRKASCAALGRAAAPGDAAAVRSLLELLEDADWRVRKAAIEAVGELADRGCEPAIRGLIARLDDTRVGERRLLDTPSPADGDVKTTAVRSLLRVARPGDPSVLAALGRLCQRDPGAASRLARDAISGLSALSI